MNPTRISLSVPKTPLQINIDLLNCGMINSNQWTENNNEFPIVASVDNYNSSINICVIVVAVWMHLKKKLEYHKDT